MIEAFLAVSITCANVQEMVGRLRDIDFMTDSEKQEIVIELKKVVEENCKLE